MADKDNIWGLVIELDPMSGSEGEESINGPLSQGQEHRGWNMMIKRLRF